MAEMHDAATSSLTETMDTDGLFIQQQQQPNLHNPSLTDTAPSASLHVPTALHKRTPSLSQYTTTSIAKHYQVNQQILAAFESHFESKYYHVAYAMGLQFVETALLEIPKHGYFYSPRHERERMESSLEAVRVTNLLQQIQSTLGHEYRAELDRVQRLHTLALQQVEQASEDQYETTQQRRARMESQRARTEHDLREQQSSSSRSMSDWVVLDPFLICSGSLSNVLCPDTSSANLAASPETTPISADYSRASYDNHQRHQEEDHNTRLLLQDSNAVYPEIVEDARADPPAEYREALVALQRQATPPLPTATTTPKQNVREADLLGLHHMAPLPFVKSPTDPPKRTSVILAQQTQDQHEAEVPPSTHLRQSSWSIPPQNLSAVQSDSGWGQPPPLLAQENFTINTSNHRKSSTTAAASQSPPKSSRPKSSLGDAPLPPRPPRPPHHVSVEQLPASLTEEDWMFIQNTSTTTRNETPPHIKGQDSFSSIISRTHQRTTTAEQMVLERALFLSGLEVTRMDPAEVSTLAADKEPPRLRVSSSSRLEFATLSALYHEDFTHLCQSKRIRLTTAATYQGRLPESTNGCTVIAPLLCMHHLLNDDTPPDAGLPDAAIVQVIDTETPVILGDLRRRLGLSDQAFLIPSDVHDYLIENGQLHQSQFVNVVGGNFLQDAHLNNFVSALNEAPCKLAATLFFHEHVICILKLDRGDGKFWYDCIDSLPLPETLRQIDESVEDFWRRFGVLPDDPRLTQVLAPFTVRLRCLDAEALQACLRWYACSKFTEENVRYIDQYDWEEAQSDFDPRVFQAFLWGSPQG
eukprot:scaffold5444_cov157-Amphora_coffeaeformis.AAC.4